MSRKKKKGGKKKVHTAYVYKPCLHPPLQVWKGVLTGGKDEKQNKACDLRIALDSWAIRDELDGFDTHDMKAYSSKRFIFVPVEDRQTPTDISAWKHALKIAEEYLKAGKHVHVTCIGGHGRTGMLIACLLAKESKCNDPVGEVRSRYCKKAVEGYDQHKFVALFTSTKMPNVEDYRPKQSSGFWDKWEGAKYGQSGSYERAYIYGIAVGPDGKKYYLSSDGTKREVGNAQSKVDDGGESAYRAMQYGEY